MGILSAVRYEGIQKMKGNSLPATPLLIAILYVKVLTSFPLL